METPTILIVEDDPVIVISLEFLMAQNGYDVFVSHSGEDALEKLKTLKPQVILMDVMLPHRTGFEVCQKIRSDDQHQDVKIILLSARGRETDINKGLSLGADAYITKPFSTRNLLETIKKLISP
jgi:two-component system, OmpR family, alkaline phosphatase synthesis response regulator PhoP